MKTPIATSLIALSTAIASPVMADVTAADVWSNQQNFYKAMGITVSGNLSGGMLNNPQFNVVLPQGIASLQITSDPIIMADNGDGTVTISYPSPMNVTIAGGIPNEGSFSAELSMTSDHYTVIASGEPGEITYVSDAKNLRLEVGEVTADTGMAGGEDLEVMGSAVLSSWEGTRTITQGNTIDMVVDFSTGETVADFTFKVDDLTSHSRQITLPMTTSGEVSLPAGGSDVMNLSAALRNGLSLVLETAGEGSSSVATTSLNGEVMNSQTTSTGSQTISASFTEDGLVVTGESSDFAMMMNEPLIFPGDLEFRAQTFGMTYDIPLNASEDPQDFRVATSMQGLTLGDSIWNLFDPSGLLPRDPAEVSFDVTGIGTNGTDLLDINGLMQLFGPPDIEIDEVTIENLRIAAVGAEATAAGSMTFDWTDMMTIPGIARPEGQVTVNLNGANALMDRLVAMGLIPEQDLMMPRMMMGMFATPVGDDALESVLEINSEGHVLANGQRLR